VTASEIVHLEGASEVDPAQWDCLARRGFQLQRWFVASENCGWEPRHISIRSSSGAVTIVPAYLTGSATLNDLHQRWLGPFSAAMAGAGWNLRPVLSVQAPFALVSEPLGADLSPRDTHQVFEALERRALADAAKAVVWPCLDTVRGNLGKVAAERGYAVVYSGASARIQVQWSSFDDYVASRSKNIRRTIKADLRGIGAAGLRIESASEFQSAAPGMDALYQDAFRRRNGRAAAAPQGFFKELSLNPSPSIRAQLTWDGSQLVGSSLNLTTPQLLEGTFAAFSAKHQGGPAYYNDLCYEPIRFACRHGIKAIDLGATALYPKVLRGAGLRRRMTLIRGTTRRWHRLFATLGSLVARRTEWKERRALGALWSPNIFEEAAE
jgi:predicted N-acyltransferase